MAATPSGKWIRTYVDQHGFKNCVFWDAEMQHEAHCRHQPGHTYCQYCWPPRGRGRGESVMSPRRVIGKLRAAEACNLRMQGYTYPQIATKLGYTCVSGAWRAVHRLRVRRSHEDQATCELYEEQEILPGWSRRRLRKRIEAMDAADAAMNRDDDDE